jgi:uncharacterized membrane protein
MSRKPTQPQDDRQQQPVILAQFGQHHSGPLPAPADLEHYERVYPGAAERIFAMAEREQAHRQERERHVDAVNSASAKRGQWLGAVIVLLAMSGAVAIGLLHGPWQIAAALVGVPLLSVVRDFTRGQRPAEPGVPGRQP